MADMITRCPKCATAFRISDSLLKSAKGVVRCGSCLNVFNASNHIEQQRKSETATQRGQSVDLHKSATSDDDSEQNQLHTPTELATEDTEPSQPTNSGRSSLQRAPRNFPPYFDNSSGGLFERSTNTNRLEVEEDDGETTDEDEAWALELLKDDSDADVTFKKITEPEPTIVAEDALGQIDELISASKQDPEAPVHDSLEDDLPPIDIEPPKIPLKAADISSTPSEPETNPSDNTTQTSVASNTMGRAKALDPTTSVKESKTTDEQLIEEELGQESSVEIEDDPIEEIELKDTPYSIAPIPTSNRQKALDKFNSRKSNKAHGEEISSIKAAIANIEPEPLEVSWQENSHFWRRRVLWPLLVLLALSALVVQIAWLEFHRLNRIEPYRSVYAKACQYLECELPELIDRSQIKTSNLLVRTHPDVAGALMVDVILQNDADFEQTFPSLLLTFSDLKNQTVASRKLSPQEYLGGELSGMNSMPIKQPIHIGIEILDPGKDAVSYSIAIVD